MEVHKTPDKHSFYARCSGQSITRIALPGDGLGAKSEGPVERIHRDGAAPQLEEIGGGIARGAEEKAIGVGYAVATADLRLFCLPFATAASNERLQLPIATPEPFSYAVTPGTYSCFCFSDHFTGGASRRLRRFAILSASFTSLARSERCRA